VAEPKPLRLKVQRAPQRLDSADINPFVSVLVETPVFHLEEPYEYYLPEIFSGVAKIGSLVKVPFGSGETLGYILDRYSQSRNQSKSKATITKSVVSVLSEVPVFTPELHGLLVLVAKRYGSRVWDLIRSAIPDRVAAAEKLFLKTDSAPRGLKSLAIANPKPKFLAPGDAEIFVSEKVRAVLRIQPGLPMRSLMKWITQARSSLGQVLIVVPDEKDLLLIAQDLSDQFVDQLVILGSHLSKSERYLNFLKVGSPATKIILGTRSAIFSTLRPNSTIIVLDEVDESMYERRSPGWNVRDVALIRSRDNSLIFLDYSPSLELMRLIESGWMHLVSSIAPKKVKVFAENGRRSSHSIIGDGLKRGSVLISTSQPGYVNGFLCQKCRNRAECECGGRLIIASSNATPSCVICQKVTLDWNCRWCGGSKPWVIKRGVSRLGQEFGRIFPNTQVLQSSSDHRIDQLPSGNNLVVATLGCEPEGEYAAVVLMDGMVLFNRTELRSDEVARDRWFRNYSMLQPSGELFISLDSAHPVAQALTKGDFQQITKIEIEQRRSAGLPPEFRLATIQGPRAEIDKISEAIASSGPFTITGPVPVDVADSRLILRIAVEQGELLSDFIFDLKRFRSLKGLPALAFRVDPYSI
jgi:primosomal protein N' (replication factor Y)